MNNVKTPHSLVQTLSQHPLDMPGSMARTWNMLAFAFVDNNARWNYITLRKRKY